MEGYVLSDRRKESFVLFGKRPGAQKKIDHSIGTNTNPEEQVQGRRNEMNIWKHRHHALQILFD